MNTDFTYCGAVLEDLGLMPEGSLSTFVVGSMARGWASPASDIDFVIVTTEEFSDERAFSLDVPLDPPAVPTVAFRHEDRRWELKYWLESQVDQLFDKISWEAFDQDQKVGDRLTEVEVVFLERLVTCLPVRGDDWIQRRRDQLEASAFRSILVMQALTKADEKVETALSQLAGDDPESGVLSARDAFGWAMDALLISHGEYGALVKWRARRFRAAAPKLLSFEEYWSYETMRTYDPSKPGNWIEAVARLCKKVSMEVEI